MSLPQSQEDIFDKVIFISHMSTIEVYEVWTGSGENKVDRNKEEDFF